MTEQDERVEGSQRGGASMESATANRSEESEQERSQSRGTAGVEGESAGEERAPLFTGEETERFRERWADVQAGFVDQPRQMVEQADDLVSDLMQQLTAGFSERRSTLEEQWSEGEEVSTEDLRVALTRYRSFFNRLLSA